MPLDTSSYSLALLRLDGRRWNELRRLTAQISTQAAADGSSYLEMGNTKVICTVNGPAEAKRAGTGSSSSGDALVVVEVGVAGFSGVDRKRRVRNDKRLSEMQLTIASAFREAIFTNLFPHSTIAITLHVLSQDGSLLAACINATTLALIDAGVPMCDYIVSCTAGSTSYASNNESADPLLDLNASEESELPFLTVATLGETDSVAVLMLEMRVQASRLEGMLAVGVDGCKHVRGILDSVVRGQGKKILGTEVAV